MRSAVHDVFALCAVISATLLHVCRSEGVTALYGGTIQVPCNKGAPMPEDLMFVKWKYEKGDIHKDLLTKQAQKEDVKIVAENDYKDRISVATNYSLLISQAKLQDQNTFTCMVVTPGDITEYSVTVHVYKLPDTPQIKGKATQLENGKLAKVGDCVAEAASPAGNIMWSKNGKPLVSDGNLIFINSSVQIDKATGLSTTFSRLDYTASKADVGATFTCSVQHVLGSNQVSAAETFPIHYPTEKVSVQVLNKVPIKEGDNVTIKCTADGNPPPTSYNFYIKGRQEKVMSDTYTLTGVTRQDSGEYNCSLVENDKLMDSTSIVVHYLEASLNPTGQITGMVGDSVNITLQKQSSVEMKVSWMKDNGKTEEPKLSKLRYQDAGYYVCEVSAVGLPGVKKSFAFELTVEGKPQVSKLTKTSSSDGKHKVLSCEAEGSPKPIVRWNINATTEKESPYINGKFTHTITVVPPGNVTVTCTASNKLGEHERSISVSSYKSEDVNDQAKLIVGIVVGLLVAALIVGLVYWLYMKKSKQGTWKTGEKEAGTSEESKKLEENNHKAEV
ncbi:C166A protein, partial [Amia calva]|nr:C166A protein [Amia calva]